MNQSSNLNEKRVDVSIVIVTYNSEQQIRNCLRSVIEQRDHITQQIVVLDNASTDGTAGVIRAEFPEVELLEPGRNLGFASGVNEAARHATGEFVLLLNPDTEIRDHAIDVVFDFARTQPAYGFYGGRTLKTDGSLEPSSCWGAPTLWSMALFAAGITTLAPRNRWLDPESLGSWPRDTVREVGVITGCFLLASADAWRKLGGFDERFFMYGEDVDLALRARLAGYRPVICPEARVMHEVGKSSEKAIDKMMLLYRGKAQLARTHWHGIGRSIAVFLLEGGVALRAGLSAVLNRIRSSDSNDSRWIELWRRRQDWRLGYCDTNKQAAGSKSVASSSDCSSA